MFLMIIGMIPIPFYNSSKHTILKTAFINVQFHPMLVVLSKCDVSIVFISVMFYRIEP